MDKKVLTKEGTGAKGTGFEGRTGSNSYSALPKSSNAGLGIDAEVATGVGYAVSNTSGYAQNVGQKEGTSGKAKLGYDEPWAKGTVASGENFGGYGASQDSRGEFGTSALSGGHSEGSTSATLGSGARAKGTGSSESGTPGRSGSMAMAFDGLKASSGQKPYAPQARAGSSKSLTDAGAGIGKKATSALDS